MMSLKEVGEKMDNAIDELRKAFDGHAKPVIDKLKELDAAMKEGLKTADRKGFERAKHLAVIEARRGDHGHDPSENIGKAIQDMMYVSPDE